MKRRATTRRRYVGRILVLIFVDMMLGAVTLADPTWTSPPMQAEHRTGDYMGGVLQQDWKYGLGTEASITTPSYNWFPHDRTGVAGDNGVRSLRAYADYYYDGSLGWPKQGQIISGGRQSWFFSLDHAASLELSYSLNGSLSKSGPDATGEISVSLAVYHMYGGGGYETLSSYSFQTGESQAISEHGNSIFYYQPPPPTSMDTYWLDMKIESVSAGFRTITPSFQETTVIARIDDFSVGITEVGASVVPIPPSVLLGVLGLGAAGLKLRKHV